MARQAATSSQWSVIRRLVTEKIPLLVLSALSSVVTLLAQLQSTGTIPQLPFAWRLNNAAVSYVAYIWQMFWPARLAAFYPHPNDQLPPLAGSFGNCISHHSQLVGNPLAEETAVHFHWLVLVCWNACARYRPGAGRRASARGSIHLPATDRFVCADCLGHHRPDDSDNDARAPLQLVATCTQSPARHRAKAAPSRTGASDATEAVTIRRSAPPSRQRSSSR